MEPVENGTYGVIQEQGDLGLGFDPVNEQATSTLETPKKNEDGE